MRILETDMTDSSPEAHKVPFDPNCVCNSHDVARSDTGDTVVAHNTVLLVSKQLRFLEYSTPRYSNVDVVYTEGNHFSTVCNHTERLNS